MLGPGHRGTKGHSTQGRKHELDVNDQGPIIKYQVHGRKVDITGVATG